MHNRETLDLIFPLMTVFTVITGLCIGSFLNVCIWRLPRGESLSHPGSHCPKCNHAIRPWENIPILSWIFLRGRCSNCGLPISVRYPLVELATGILFLLVWLRVAAFGMPLRPTLAYLPGYFFLTAALFAASFTDIESLTIPNQLTYSGMLAALVLAVVFPETRTVAGMAAPQAVLAPIISAGAVDRLAAVFPQLLAAPRALAFIDAALGIVVGGGALVTVFTASNLIWGTRRTRTEAAVDIVADPSQITIGDDAPISWDDLMLAGDRPIELRAEQVRIEPAPTDDAGERPTPETPVRIRVDGRAISIGKRSFNWTDVARLECRTRSWTVPREVLGFGDIKLLAMIGAFLGPDAAIFTLVIAAFAGTILGLVALGARRLRADGLLPFGPILAASAMLWMLRGADLLVWYSTMWQRGSIN